VTLWLGVAEVCWPADLADSYGVGYGGDGPVLVGVVEAGDAHEMGLGGVRGDFVWLSRLDQRPGRGINELETASTFLLYEPCRARNDRELDASLVLPSHRYPIRARPAFRKRHRQVIEPGPSIVDSISRNQPETVWRLGVALPPEDVIGSLAFTCAPFDGAPVGVRPRREKVVMSNAKCLRVFCGSVQLQRDIPGKAHAYPWREMSGDEKDQQ
jgi:hypothetical protein